MNLDSPEDRAKHRIRQLIWLYFWLLLIEGALRKWLLPGLSTPLLVIRDPVVLVIYLYTFRAGVFPKNGWVLALVIMATLDTMCTFFQLWDFVPPQYIAVVAAYGIHANFFHLPLIFVMGKVLTFDDVKKFGWWTLVLLVPMTILMIAQFRVGPDAFVNRTAGGEGEMIMSSMNKVRTSGPFSFVIGVVAYFSLAIGYIIWGFLNRGVYKFWLLAGCGIALIIGVSVSGSRSVVGACAVVVASLAVVLFLRPKALNRFAHGVLAVVVVGYIASRTSVFKEGAKVLSTRFSEVAEATDQSISQDLLTRSLSTFTDVWKVLPVAPALGWGLGVGTNAGAKLLVGQAGFLLMEGEWPRIVMENGPVLGISFLLWRLAFVVWVRWLTLKSVKGGNVLPLLLFSSSALPMISGQFGQPTILGFAVFVTGLTLAAMNGDELTETGANPPSETTKAPRPIRGRSVYAERLHGSPAATPERTNGSVAR
jgi:hypothetical protein